MMYSHDAYFVDLFVRISNNVAIDMYRKFGYSVYRQVLGYYSGKEDAYGNGRRQTLALSLSSEELIACALILYNCLWYT